MKINIISLNNAHSLSEDSESIAFALKKFYLKKKILYNYFNFQDTKGAIADINIFVGLINNSFIKYAPINILILDHHKFDKNWIPYLKRLDYVLCKTELSVELVKPFINKEKIVLVGSKIRDRFITSAEKKFDSFLLVLGQSNYRQEQIILDNWQEDYPKLTVLCGRNLLKNRNITKKEQENITYIEKYLIEEDYSKLLTEHGVHLCLSSASTYAHTFQDCLSAKSIPICIDSFPYRYFVSNHINAYMVKSHKKKKLPNSFGSEYLFKPEEFKLVLEKVIKIMKEDEILLEEMAEKNKKNIRQENMKYDRVFKEFFDKIWALYKKNKPLKERYEIYDEDLPNVSIITPTYNHNKFFKLAIRNYLKTDYPINKLEWIIVDDSEVSVENILLEELGSDYKKHNINYIKLENKESIGNKRNIAVDNSKYDIIVCMDDDDYYQPGSVKFRVACLEHLNREVVGCSGLGLLEINKIISNVSFSSFIEPFDLRYYESTLGFRKKWWQNNKFSDTNVNEGQGLLKEAIEVLEDIDWRHIIVSLKHYSNTNNRVVIKGETNGSHFNFSDELFNLITNLELDEEDKQDNSEKNKKIPKDNKEKEDNNVGDTNSNNDNNEEE